MIWQHRSRVCQLESQCSDLTEQVSALRQDNHILCHEVRRMSSLQRFSFINTPLDRTSGSLPSFWSPVQSSPPVVDVSIDHQEFISPPKEWTRGDNLRKLPEV